MHIYELKSKKVVNSDFLDFSLIFVWISKIRTNTILSQKSMTNNQTKNTRTIFFFFFCFFCKKEKEKENYPVGGVW